MFRETSGLTRVRQILVGGTPHVLQAVREVDPCRGEVGIVAHGALQEFCTDWPLSTIHGANALRIQLERL
jgi:hypothetical protein